MDDIGRPVAVRFGSGAWHCQGCGAELTGGVSHCCAGLQKFMGFDRPHDTWLMLSEDPQPPVREDHDAGDEHHPLPTRT